MKLMILDKDYPSPGNNYGDAFVEMRVRGYIECGHQVRVLRFFLPRETSYQRAGVDVQHCMNPSEIVQEVDAYSPDVVLVHFFQGWMFERVFRKISQPIVVWVHGFEALSCVRRIFNVRDGKEFVRYCMNNTVQLLRLRRLIAHSNRRLGRVQFVFVSRWMQRVCEADTFIQVDQSVVIPNPIDTQFFNYETKDPALRKRVLMIRSFNSRKYATDIACRAILALSGRADFQSWHFTVVGDGVHFDADTAPLNRFGNITILRKFLTHEEIRQLHSKHGVFLCPTRQDAQGVSMCEAMSSGLVPIASDCTAIPEFVKHGGSGLLGNKPREFSNAMITLASRQELFAELSKGAADSVHRNLCLRAVTKAELTVIGGAIGANSK